MLLSDGKSTHGRDPLPVADRARELGVPVYTVALGTRTGTLPDGERVPPDTEALREIAERSGGARVHGRSRRARCSEVYERLGSQVATEREDREVTAAFAGGALVLLGRRLRPVAAVVPAPGLSSGAPSGQIEVGRLPDGA